MRTRTFALIALAVIVVAGNTALVLWLKGRPRRPLTVAGRAGSIEPPRETRIVTRAPTAEEAPLPDASPTEADRPRLRVLVGDAEGKPVTGASVRAEGNRRSKYSPFAEAPFAEGTTGADGACELVLARRARTRVVVEKEGFVRAEVPADGTEIAVRLEREGIVRGRVVEEGTRAPIAGAAVRAGWSAEPTGVATTGSDGTFLLRGLRAGPRSVEAESAAHPSKVVSVEVLAGGDTSVEIALPRGIDLRGRVVVPGSDRSVEGGTISLPRDPNRLEVETSRSSPIGPEGRFELHGIPNLARTFRVEAGGAVYRVSGQKPEFDPATGEQVGEILVPLPPSNPYGREFKGVVRDGEGRPVEGARVIVGPGVLRSDVLFRGSAEDEWFPERRTDGEGRYRLVSEREGNEILVLHPDFAPVHHVLPRGSWNTTVDLTLHPGVRVVVAVRDSAGRPAADAEVVALLRHPDPREAFMWFRDVFDDLRASPRTDSRGLATLTHVGAGSWYLVARSADGKEGGRAVLEVGAAGGDVAADLVLARLPSVSGRILDASGNAVAGAWVNTAARDPMGDWTRTTSAPDGRFTLASILALPFWEPLGGVYVNASSRESGATKEPVLIPFDGEADLELTPGGPFVR
jgi:hypothetical protein